jgi:hypothetical protein
VRLSSYYQLPCDYGTAVMISWERGVAPIYLCEGHATQMGWSGKNCEAIPVTTPESVDRNHPTEQPKTQLDRKTVLAALNRMMSWANYFCLGPVSKAYQAVERHAQRRLRPWKRSIPSGGPADAQVGLAKKDLAVVRGPVRDLASGNSAKPLVNKATGDRSREDFEAYGNTRRVKPSTTTEEKQAVSADLERLCASRYGERCTCQATVHCPICARWFCDAHAEDEKWHPCALTIYKLILRRPL